MKPKLTKPDAKKFTKSKSVEQVNQAPSLHSACNSLPPIRLRCVDLLLSGKRVGEVADILSVTRQQIWQWKKDPDFQKEIERRRDLLWADIADPLEVAAQEAIITLRQLMTVGTPWGTFRKESARVKAAQAVLRLFEQR